jgi:tRNA U38,U39,U40 pseudouridine synthase TruA
MMKTLLVLDEKTCDLTRSGRTDKGVSALGNVIAVRLRTNKLKVD